MNTSHNLSESSFAKKWAKLVPSLHIFNKLKPLEIIHTKSHFFRVTIQCRNFVLTILRVLLTIKLFDRRFQIWQLFNFGLEFWLHWLLPTLPDTWVKLYKVSVIIKTAKRVIWAFSLLFCKLYKRKLLTRCCLYIRFIQKVVGIFCYEIIVQVKCLC
jgi:hypothetical protein